MAARCDDQDPEVDVAANRKASNQNGLAGPRKEHTKKWLTSTSKEMSSRSATFLEQDAR